jgi:hypothetical protein
MRRMARRWKAHAADATSLLRFLAKRRSLWLALLVALLLLLTGALYVVQTAAVAPYVYPLF